VWFFAFNKTLLAVFNGLRKMKAYAAFNAVRSVMLLGGILTCAALDVPGERLTGVISAAEAVLFLCLLVSSAGLMRAADTTAIREWLGRHLAFGIKSIPLGIMSEAGYRVDILLLGYFAGEYQVGVYSFAAMLVEGFNQLPYVFRRNVDPILTQLIVAGRKQELRAMIVKGLRLGLAGMSLAGAAFVAAFPLVVRWVVGNPSFMEGWGLFAVLMSGAVVQAVYIPFSGILVQGGYPGHQTILVLSMVLVNLVLGVALIPFFGAMGAAVAAAAAYVSFVFFLKRQSGRVLGVRI
jgi:O-antigen/teichoic acid export membrane protein